MKRFRFRSLLGLLFAVVLVGLMGCGGSNVAVPTTYSSEQIAQLDIYTPRVAELRDRFPELEGYLQSKDWVNISAFIHGPMGELRANLGRVTARLLPADAEQAQFYAAEIGTHLEKLDAAAAEYNQIEAAKQYREALDDFDAFLALVPEPSV
ncbi:MAG: photosystem II protein PsbQ [Cyanobacteria bacterium J06607_6]